MRSGIVVNVKAAAFAKRSHWAAYLAAEGRIAIWKDLPERKKDDLLLPTYKIAFFLLLDAVTLIVSRAAVWCRSRTTTFR